MNSFLKRRRGGGLPDQNPFSKGGRAVKFWQWKNIVVGPRSLMLLSHQHLLFEQSKSLLTMVFAYCHSDWQTMKAFIRQAIKHLVCASLHLAWLCGVVLYLCRGCTFPMCHHCVLKPAQYLYLFGARVNCFCCAILCIWRGFVNLHCTALAVWLYLCISGTTQYPLSPLLFETYSESISVLHLCWYKSRCIKAVCWSLFLFFSHSRTSEQTS